MKEETFNNIKDKLNILNIIDIRDNYLYNMGNVEGSINIPMNLLLMNPNNYLNKNEVYYIYCNRGINSRIVSERLNREGYNTYSIKGGYLEYQSLYY